MPVACHVVVERRDLQVALERNRCGEEATCIAYCQGTYVRAANATVGREGQGTVPRGRGKIVTPSNDLPQDGLSGTKPTTFARKASGMIRQARPRDVFVFNLNMQNIAIGTIFSLLLIPGLYPGANIYLSTLIALAISLPISWVYATLAGIYPRSGGDYVYVSRIVHPAIGFMSNLSYCVWGVFYIGVSGVFFGIYGLGPVCRVIGSYTSNRSIYDAGNWFAEPTGKFIMAIAIMAVFTAIFIFGGMKLYFRIQNVNFILAMASLVVIFIIGLVVSRHTAYANLDSAVKAVGGKALSPLATGQGGAAFSLKQTMYAAIWPWLAFNSAIYSTYMGGEVKSPARTQVVGIMGALVWCGVWMLILPWAMYRMLGEGFFAGLSGADPTAFGLSTTPTFGELSALSVGSAVIGIVVMVFFALWCYVWIAPYTVLVTRSVFAWSMDRVGPAWLGEIHPKYLSPRNALLVVFALGIVSSAFYSYGKLSVLSGTVGITASMIVVAVAGLLVPYRKTELWESSPGAGRWLGLPVIVWVSLLALPLLGLIEWALIADVNSGTSLEGSPRILAFSLILFVVGFPVYYVIRAIQRRRGIDIDLSFGEIPPE